MPMTPGLSKSASAVCEPSLDQMILSRQYAISVTALKLAYIYMQAHDRSSIRASKICLQTVTETGVSERQSIKIDHIQGH